MKVGFIGLGIMGKPMSINLLKKGYEVLVNTRRKETATDVLNAGATYCDDQQELARSVDVLMTMLPDGSNVEGIMLNGPKLAEHMKEGSVFIDMSSINPAVSKKIYEALQTRNVEMLDAPVSGGEPKAIDGTLSFMVGGKKEVFEKCKELLLAMGSSAVLCGDVGAGNTTKLANQIIVAGNIQAVAEAMTFVKKAGVDPELVFNAIKGGLAGSTVMNAKVPLMLQGDDKPGFRIDLHIKDLNNAIQSAHEVGAYVPMTMQVQELMMWMRSMGYGSNDHGALRKYYELLDNVTLKKD